MRIIEEVDGFGSELNREIDQTFNKSDASELKQDVNQAQKLLGDDANVAFSDDAGDIEEALSDALMANQEEVELGGNEFVNVLLIGEAGTGKTSRVYAWAKKHGINIMYADAKSMDATDVGGAIAPNKDNTEVNRLATTEFNALDRPNSVLFLDEYNRAKKTVRSSLLTLVNDHKIRDARNPNGERIFPNFLFTVAAINPPGTFDDVQELDQAELSRFYQVEVDIDPVVTLNFLNAKYDQMLQRAKTPEVQNRILGRKQIANTLLSSPDFSFDNGEEAKQLQKERKPILNPRSLTKLLTMCNGTKKNFLQKWNAQCNPNKKKMAERILAQYKDIDNKANSVFKDNDSMPAFMRGPSVYDKLKNSFDDEF